MAVKSLSVAPFPEMICPRNFIELRGCHPACNVSSEGGSAPVSRRSSLLSAPISRPHCDNKCVAAFVAELVKARFAKATCVATQFAKAISAKATFAEFDFAKANVVTVEFAIVKLAEANMAEATCGMAKFLTLSLHKL